MESEPKGISDPSPCLGMIIANRSLRVARQIEECPAMNVAMTECGASTAQLLKDKVSLVTGSTSGIGLGIVRAFAAPQGLPWFSTASASRRNQGDASGDHFRFRC